MNEVIEKALKDVGIPCFMGERPKNTMPCIVYHYIELAGSKADNIEETLKYDVYINLFAINNLNKSIKLVKDALIKARFIKQVVNNPIKIDKTDYYQTTMNFTKIEIAN